METVTTASAGIAITTPWWLPAANLYVQLGVAVLGGLWLATQIVAKIYVTFYKK
jgi:hypothetical protein